MFECDDFPKEYTVYFSIDNHEKLNYIASNLDEFLNNNNNNNNNNNLNENVKNKMSIIDKLK